MTNRLTTRLTHRQPLQTPWDAVRRRGAFACLALIFAMVTNSGAQADTATGWQPLQHSGNIVLFRHAIAPGGGDPDGFVAGDCTTQRNLSAEGRAQAKRLGERLRESGVLVREVWHSEWCRTRDTAQLAFPAKTTRMRAETAFNSFFGTPASASAQTEAARKLLLGWRGPGALVVVTHQVNITALTGVIPQSGEGVVVRANQGQLVVQGHIAP